MTLLQVTDRIPIRLTGPATLNNRGPGTVYYDSTQDASSANNEGSIASGSTGHIADDKYVIASATSLLDYGPTSGSTTSSTTASSVLTVYNVKDAAYGAAGDGVTDDFDAIQNAITAANTAGGGIVYLPAGTYYLNKTSGGGLKLPRSSAGITIKGAGTGATTIKLTSNVPRFLDFNKVADGDTFQNFTVEDITVDANNVGGLHHVVIGGWQGGVFLTRYHLSNITVRRVNTINVMTTETASNTNNRRNIDFTVSDTLTSGPQYNVSRIRVQDCKMLGGNYGVGIAGTGTASTVNVYIDDVIIERCYHDTLIQATAFAAHANYHVGSRGYGGTVTIRDCIGFRSWDVGIEVNAMQNVLVENCYEQDCYSTNFYHTHYNNPPDAATQKVEFRGCTSLISSSGGSFSYGFLVEQQASNPALNNVYLRSCTARREVPTIAESASSTGSLFSLNRTGTTTMRKLVIDNFNGEVTGTTYSGTTAASWWQMACQRITTSGEVYVRLHDIDLTYNGTDAGSGDITIYALGVTGNVHLDIDGFRYTQTNNGASSFTMRGIELGGTTSAIRGRIRRLYPVSVTGDSFPRGIVIRDTGTTTLQAPFWIVDCDFSKVAGMTGAEVAYASPPQNQDKVYHRGNRWVTWPVVPAAITPGASPYTYQNLDGYREEVIVQGGTVSKIEFSRDNTTFFDTGLTAGMFSLDQADYLRVTYTAAPNMRKVHSP